MSAAHEASRPVLPEVGQVLDGRFELLGTLGEGGMGHVFRARDRRLGREVALKLITPRYLGRAVRELRFLRELELGRRGEPHRNLVDYLDGGRLRHLGWPFVVMALVPGKDLASRLAHGPLPPPLATRLARQVAGAVLALHRAGVVHRDVTTMNVLVADGDAVLIDLSHACEVATPQVSPGAQQRLTRDNEVPGTHHFMAPEQARAEPAHPAMDVYAFGVMLVHMLTGVAPGPCGREAFIELQSEGRLRPPRIDTRVYTAVPLALAELVDACVATEPRRRPSMGEVVQRLDEQLVVMTASVESDGPIAAANEAGATEGTGRRQGVGSRRRALAAVMGVVVVLAAAAWLWPRSATIEPASAGAVVPQREPEARAVEQPSEGDAAAAPEPALPPATAPMQPEPQQQADASPPAPTREAEAPKRPRRARRSAPRPSPPSSPPEPPTAESCEEILTRAAAARTERRWSQVVQLTNTSRCWDDAAARARLRIKALSELQRYGECVKLGTTSTDAEVQRLATHCARQLDAEAP
ncbi:MAG: serine/threonine-protein kinase [Nannocystaceae bacterium]